MLKSAPPTVPKVKYAKLALPRLHRAIARHRLFERIDALTAEHSALWIASPPGSGKTTLAASYIAELNRPTIWYQIDALDNDPATMFFYATEAMQAIGASAISFSPNPIHDKPHSARAFFREFYANLPTGTIIVFDNMHEFDLENSGELIDSAFTEIPSEIKVIALSRHSPPARLAKMQLSGQLANIGWPEMRFNESEARQMIGLSAGQESNDTTWLDITEGWAAGIAMLRDLHWHSSEGLSIQNAGRDAVFRYFAGEIFGRLPQKEQHALLLLSCVSGVSTQDARILTNDHSSGDILNRFYEKNLFVERRGNTERTYHFHALFQEFLEVEARERLNEDERSVLQERAATILENRGRLDEVAKLFQDSENHTQLANFLLRNAAQFMNTGRSQIWREWMSGLPPSIVELQPELWYWLGISLIDIAPRRARKILIQAEKSFREINLRDARLLTLSAIIESYDIEWTEFEKLDYWAEQMQEALKPLDATSFDSDLSIILHSRLLLAIFLSDPKSPLLPSLAKTIVRELPTATNSVERLKAGAILLRFYESGLDDTDSELANWVVELLKDCANDPNVSPINRVKWYKLVGRRHTRDGKFEESQVASVAAKDVVIHHNLDPLLSQLIEISHLIGAGKLDASRVLLDELRKTLSPTNIPGMIELNTLEANWRSLSGNIDGAIHAIGEVVRVFDEHHLPTLELSRIEIHLASCHAAKGEFSAANTWFAKALEHSNGYDQLLVNEARQFVGAYQQWMSGEIDDAIRQLRDVLTSHRKRQATTLFPLIPSFACRLAEIALTNGIEVEHVQSIITRQNLVGPSRYVPNWPWPVSVQTFGRFELLLNGQAIDVTRKGQQRLLLLLKALIASGERGTTLQSLAIQLWPDSEDTKSVMSVSVHRLRKLLACEEAVVIGGGKIRLAKEKVWTDLGAFSAICDEIQELKAPAPIDSVRRLCAGLQDLYLGSFCNGEEESWMIPTRERLRSRFLNAAEQLEKHLRDSDHVDLAIALFRRALEAEPLAEACYRGLMRCSHAQGDVAGVASIYRRCRETLYKLGNLNPSLETTKLASSMGVNSL